MADPPIKAFDRYNEKITVTPEQIPELESLGGRVANPQEIAEDRLATQYAQRTPLAKALGIISGQGLPPEIQAWKEGAISGMGGPVMPLMAHVVDQIDPKAGAAMRQQLKDVETAHPDVFTAGQIAGFLGSAAATGAAAPLAKAGSIGAQALRATPGALVSRGGVWAGEKALPWLASRAGVNLAGATSLAGKIAARSAVYGAQGLAEGALIGGMEQLRQDLLEKEPELNGAKYAAAMAHAGLYGLGLGALTGAGLAAGSAAVGALRRAPRAAIEKVAEAGAAEAREILTPLGEVKDAMGATIKMPGRWEGAAERIKTWRGTAARAAEGLEEAGTRAKSVVNAAVEDAEHLRNIAKEALEANQPEVAAAAEAKAAEADAFRNSVINSPETALAKMLDDAKAPVVKGGSLEEGVEGAAAKEAGAMPRAADKYNATKLEALRAAFGTLEAPASVSKEALRRGIDLADLGETMMREKIYDPSKGFFEEGVLKSDPEHAFERSEAAFVAKSKELGTLRKSVLQGQTINAEEFAGVLNDVYKTAAKNQAMYGPAMPELRRIVRAVMSDITEGAPADLWSGINVDLDKLVKARIGVDSAHVRLADKVEATVAGKIVDSLRDRMEAVIMREVNDAAARAGTPELAAKVRDLKRDVMHLSIIRRGAFDSVSRNRVSLSRQREAARSIVGGALTGDVHQVTRGAMRYGLVSRGAQMKAWGLWKMGQLRELLDPIAAVDQSTLKAARGAVAPQPGEVRAAPRAGEPARSPRSSYRREPVKGDQLRTPAKAAAEAKETGNVGARIVDKAQKIVELVKQIQMQPGRLEQAIKNGTKELGEVAPMTAGAYSAALVRGFALIASKMPARVSNTDPLDPLQRPALTVAEADSIVTTTEYVVRPKKALDELASGVVSPEGMEVLRVMLPPVYEQLQMRIAEAVAYQAARNREVPFEQRLKLSFALGTPMDASMRDPSIAFVQKFLETAPEPPKPRGSGGGGKLDTKPGQFDRIEERSL